MKLSDFLFKDMQLKNGKIIYLDMGIDLIGVPFQVMDIKAEYLINFDLKQIDIKVNFGPIQRL